MRLTPTDLASLPVLHRAVIPEEYRDRMGHMNVTWYTHLFSEATGIFFRNLGMDGEYMKREQAGSFALEAHIRYLSECLVGDQVYVCGRAVARTEKRFHYVQFLVNEDKNVLSASCEFVGAHIDMKVRRMSAIPDETAAAFDQLVEEHNQLDWPAPLCGSMQP